VSCVDDSLLDGWESQSMTIHPVPAGPSASFDRLLVSAHVLQEQSYIRGGERHNVHWTRYYLWAQNTLGLPITEERLYHYAQHYIYMGWYYKRGIDTIWYKMNTDEQLCRSVPHPEEHVDELAYVPQSHQNVRAISI
jgi:hypothetical protein